MKDLMKKLDGADFLLLLLAALAGFFMLAICGLAVLEAVMTPTPLELCLENHYSLEDCQQYVEYSLTLE